MFGKNTFFCLSLFCLYKKLSVTDIPSLSYLTHEPTLTQNQHTFLHIRFTINNEELGVTYLIIYNFFLSYPHRICRSQHKVLYSGNQEVAFDKNCNN